MDSSHRRPNFRSTHWSVVAAARDESNPASQQALTELCERYWQPLYAFIRRSGHSPQDAEDLTQGFFSQLLEKKSLEQADQHRGKFRTFLLAALKHYVSNQRAKERAQRRGGGKQPVSLDFHEAEQNYQAVATDRWTPDALFERQWALSLLNQVLARLQTSYEHEGKAELFRCLKPTLTGGAAERTYSELARDLDTTTGALKVAVHRLRKAYRRQLCEEIALTLTTDDEVDTERDVLLKALIGQ